MRKRALANLTATLDYESKDALHIVSRMYLWMTRKQCGHHTGNDFVHDVLGMDTETEYLETRSIRPAMEYR